MGQAEIAVIAVLSFAAGFVFRHAWPLFVAWQDAKMHGYDLAPVKRPYQDTKLGGIWTKGEEPAAPHGSPPRRRLGLAEMRARKESESFKPIEHQAQVTQNNIAAMEGK